MFPDINGSASECIWYDILFNRFDANLYTEYTCIDYYDIVIYVVTSMTRLIWFHQLLSFFIILNRNHIGMFQIMWFNDDMLDPIGIVH